MFLSRTQIKNSEQIKMANTMRYRLALDLGSTSLGWAMIRLDAEDRPCAIIKAGVRIFPDGRNPKDGSSLAVTRRDARSMRRRRDRLLKRKNRLLDALTRLGFFPQQHQERAALVKLNPYVLRAKGLDEALSGPEFARALFHINQRRGFSSNRKTDKNDNDSGTLKRAIKELREKLVHENCRTLGEWLAKRHASGDSVRARLRGKTQKDKAYDYYANRAMIADEFDTLWAEQAKRNPALFTEVAGAELKDILLHQRPLKPVVPGRCTLIPEEPRAPLALPSTQRFRIYQELNHLRILTAGLQDQVLTLAQRDTLAALLENKSDVTFKNMATTLKLPGTTSFNLEDIKREKLKGNATSAALSKKEYFGAAWYRFEPALQDDIVTQLLEEASESRLIEWLQIHTGISEAIAEKIVNASLPEGYGRLGRTALGRILPVLISDVVTYDKAVIGAGFDSHSALSHSQQTGEVMEALPYYGIPLRRHVAFEKNNPRNDEERYGKIANPTVHIGLNQVRVVVNALIKEYGHPDEIIIEVTRDLKLSRERKLEIQREQKEKQDLNDIHVKEACRVLELEPTHLDKAKRREISQKMQLWRELNPKNSMDRCCPYTGERICIDRLLNGDVEIEHILPFKRTLDDSLNNKTVALTRANRVKGNQTPYEAFGRTPRADYDYEAILQRATMMPANKKKRFAIDGMEQWLDGEKDFLPRALNDTAYLSRIAKEYLSCVCPHNKVRAIPGRMTAILRGKFGLNQFLSGNELKNREDHRHHAIDAMVIGITDQGMLQRFANANANGHVLRLADDLLFPWSIPSYKKHVERALQHIVISYKPEHGYQGAMHEATAWGLRDDGQVQHYPPPEEGKNRKRKVETRNVIPFSNAKALERHGVNAEGLAKPYKGYVGGSNYCMEIWRNETGRWESEVISTFQAYQIIRAHGEEAGWKKLRNPKMTQSGKPLVMRLMNKDYVRLEIDGKIRTMVIAKIGGNGQFFMADHNEANVDARNRDKENSFGYVSKMAGSLQKASGRRCTVSETGKLRDPGFKA
jgi:CRISPR-associated endonuclease Csn1